MSQSHAAARQSRSQGLFRDRRHRSVADVREDDSQAARADDAAAIRDLSLRIFASASAIAAQRDVILADTKFEFGRDRETGQICLADEVLTSDSSRYWDAREYAAGNRGLSFDKQIVRDWLSDHWNKKGTPPALPAEIVSHTAARYADLIERLTG